MTRLAFQMDLLSTRSKRRAYSRTLEFSSSLDINIVYDFPNRFHLSSLRSYVNCIDSSFVISSINF